MKNLSISIYLLVAMFSTSFLLTSCEAESVIEQEINYDGNEKSVEGGTTLNEFVQSLTHPEEINFFNTTPITDNTPLHNSIVNGIAAQPLMCTFRWPQWKHDCNGAPTGPCAVLFPLGGQFNAMGYFDMNHLVIEPSIANEGITIDGYFPVLHDIVIDASNTIPSGIYVANFDPSTGTYNSVVVNLQ